MEILYEDNDILVCVKPNQILSTDEPGGLPDLIREYLQDPKANVRTVHRLDRVVSGLMVLARNKKSASELSRQIREDQFQKEYTAVVHGCLPEDRGTFRDLLLRNKQERKTYVTEEPGKDVQEAILHYRAVSRKEEMTRVKIRLVTGRTHQIRAQFSSRGFPLVGDRKYSLHEDPCEIALFSSMIGFTHPRTGEKMAFSQEPPAVYPWTEV